MGFKEEVFEFLAKRPGNFAAAARHFGKSRAQIVDLCGRFPEKLKDIEESHLDELEEQVYLSTGGKGRSDFKMNEALKLLSIKRPKAWGGRVKKEDEGPPPMPPQLASAQYVINGSSEYINTRPAAPKTTTIRVDDAPGGFFEDTLTGGIGRMDQEDGDTGNGLSRDGNPDISGPDGDSLG